jgi:cadmium resistance protein CadD (predicted permease)
MDFIASIGPSIATAIVTFAITNLDDFLVLIVYFARARTEEGRSSVYVCIGQFLGFSALLAISMLGMVFGAFLRYEYISLMGFIPILFALKLFYELYIEDKSDSDEAIQAESTSTASAGFESAYQNDTGSKNVSDEETGSSNKINSTAGCFPEILELAALTMANGSDNVAIYMPLFASASPAVNVINIIVFYCMLTLWCLVSFCLVGRPEVSSFLHHYGKFLVPFCLVGLGVYILSSSVIFQ